MGPGTASLACARLIVSFAPFNTALSFLCNDAFPHPGLPIKDDADGDQREFDLETRVTTNGNLIIPEMFHGCVLNK